MLPIPPEGWGAVEKAIFQLSTALRTLGAETEIVNRPGHGRSLDEYRFALRLGSFLRGRSWDVLHASTPVVANRISQLGHPFVYTSHSRHWFGTQGITERWGLHLERRAVRRAVRTIALTPEVAQAMREGVPGVEPSRLQVIPNGVDTSRYVPRPAERTGLRVLGVGAIHPRKRWHVGIGAFAQVPEAQVTLVGPVQDPAYAAELRRKAGGASLTLAGEVPEAELCRLYGISDVFFLPSGSELMSLAAMEALSSGLPVVGTSVLSGVVDADRNGLLVPEPQDLAQLEKDLGSALRSLLTDQSLRTRLGAAGREKAVSTWDWTVIAKATLALYSGIEGAPRHP